MSSSNCIAIGIDIGGGTTRIGAVDTATAKVVVSALAKTPDQGDPSKLEAMLHRLVAEVTASCGVQPGRFGLAIPGIRDASGDVMLRAVNLPALTDVNIRDLALRAGCDAVVLESDVNAAGWAQWHAARSDTGDIARCVYFSLGTGVGGCTILDGKIVRHTRGGPGHLGHLIVDTSQAAPLCPCGARGCFEAVLQNARSAGGMLDAAGSARTVDALALLALDVAHIYAPDRILIGGGVIDHAPEIVGRAAEVFELRRSRISPPELRIERAPLSADAAGVIGAALLASR